MTLNTSVTDDRLGAFYRKTAAIADRLDKSLPYDAVMRALQRIHDGEFGPSEFAIHVDRSVCPTYPDWVQKVLHPELESVGPTDYSLADVDPWLHDGQKDGKWITGNTILAYLEESGELQNCLSLQDAEEIKKLGIATFRKFFGNKTVFFWKSAVRHRRGRRLVPYLCVSGGGVVLSWHWLGLDWNGFNPAARLASSA